MGVRRQRFPQAGEEIGRSGPEYCGRLGKVANCQAGMFLAYVSPLGDKGLYLPESWTSDWERCAAAGVPGERVSYRSKTKLALEMLERALELGHLRAGWVAGDDAFGMSPSFRDGLVALGMRYVWTFREAPRCGPWSLLGPARKITRNIKGPDAPANPSCGMGSAGPWSSAVMSCRMGLGGR